MSLYVYMHMHLFIISSVLSVWQALDWEYKMSKTKSPHSEFSLVSGKQYLQYVFHLRSLAEGLWEHSRGAPVSGQRQSKKASHTATLRLHLLSFTEKACVTVNSQRPGCLLGVVWWNKPSLGAWLCDLNTHLTSVSSPVTEADKTLWSCCER